MSIKRVPSQPAGHPPLPPRAAGVTAHCGRAVRGHSVLAASEAQA